MPAALLALAIGALRDRDHRVRHHGPAARGRDRLRRQHPVRRPAHLRLRARRRGRRPAAHRDRVHGVPQDRADRSDGLFIAGNLLSAVAPSYGVLMAGRIVAALSHGAFFGVGSVVAASLVPRRGRRVRSRLMFTGLTVANVLGVPGGHAARPAVRLAIDVLGRDRARCRRRCFGIVFLVPRQDTSDGRAAAERAGRVPQSAGVAGAGDDGARVRRRVRVVHLHRAHDDRGRGLLGRRGDLAAGALRRRSGRRQPARRQGGGPVADAESLRDPGAAGRRTGRVRLHRPRQVPSAVTIAVFGAASGSPPSPRCRCG